MLAILQKVRQYEQQWASELSGIETHQDQISMAIHHLRLYINLISTSVLRDQLFSLHLVIVSNAPSKQRFERVDILVATITSVEDG